MPGPIDIIVSARKRIARNAAIGGFLYSVLPVIAAYAFALAVHPVARMIQAHYGYELTQYRAELLTRLLAVVGTIALMQGAIRAWREFRRADNFAAAAEEVDQRVGAHEEIITLATLADPAIASESRAPQSPLFPLLFQRAAKFLEGFDPAREFPLNPGDPLKRSSIFAGLVGVLMVLAMLGLVRQPSPMQIEASHLRKIADEIARTASTPGDTALAEKVRDAADALSNPSLPPQEKQKKLEAVRAQIEQRNQNAQQARSEVGTGKGSGKGNSGSGSGESRAEQQANAQGGSGQGQSKGQGGGSESQSASNQNNGGSGQGSKQGGQNNDKGGDKNKNQNNVDLQNELAKAEAQIETAGAQQSGSSNEPGSDKNQPGPKAGSNPNQKGPGKDPNRPGSIPKQGMGGEQTTPSGAGNQSAQDMGSNQGDTHLGEFPNATKTQRYLKPGEGGSGVNVKDARYVTFKIPNAPTANSGGRAVVDTSRPTASTPYVNAPLAMTKDTTLPDEQQLVPPRYRDLIH